jgi:hypothetical protein
MNSLSHLGTFLVGIAAMLTFLYGQAFLTGEARLPDIGVASPVVNTGNNDMAKILVSLQAEVKSLRDKLVSMQGELQTANDRALRAESESKAKDSEIQSLNNQLRVEREKAAQRERTNAGPPTPVPPPQPKQPDQERTVRLAGSEVVRVRLVGAERSGSRVSLVFVFENVDTDPIRIGMNDMNVKLMDAAGSEWKVGQTTGIALNKYGSFGGAYLELAPLSKLTSRFTFTADAPGGSRFDFLASVILRRGQESAQQSIAFNDVRPQ